MTVVIAVHNDQQWAVYKGKAKKPKAIFSDIEHAYSYIEKKAEAEMPFNLSIHPYLYGICNLKYSIKEY